MDNSGTDTKLKPIELLFAVLIVGFVGMVAVPELTPGANQGANAPVDPDQVRLQDAINCYYGDHYNTYPAAGCAGTNAINAAETFTQQLTMRSNAKGETSYEETFDFPFGPYLHHGIPVQKQMANNRVTIVSQRRPLTTRPQTGTGWMYNSFTGQLIANTAQNAGRKRTVKPRESATTGSLDATPNTTK